MPREAPAEPRCRGDLGLGLCRNVQAEPARTRRPRRRVGPGGEATWPVAGHTQEAPVRNAR